MRRHFRRVARADSHRLCSYAPLAADSRPPPTRHLTAEEDRRMHAAFEEAAGATTQVCTICNYRPPSSSRAQILSPRPLQLPHPVPRCLLDLSPTEDVHCRVTCCAKQANMCVQCSTPRPFVGVLCAIPAVYIHICVLTLRQAAGSGNKPASRPQEHVGSIAPCVGPAGQPSLVIRASLVSSHRIWYASRRPTRAPYVRASSTVGGPMRSAPLLHRQSSFTSTLS